MEQLIQKSLEVKPDTRPILEIIEQELNDGEQLRRAELLFRKLVSEGRKKEAKAVYNFALNYNVDFGAN